MCADCEVKKDWPPKIYKKFFYMHSMLPTKGFHVKKLLHTIFLFNSFFLNAGWEYQPIPYSEPIKINAEVYYHDIYGLFIKYNDTWYEIIDTDNDLITILRSTYSCS